MTWKFAFENQNKCLDMMVENIPHEKMVEAFEFMNYVYERLPSYKHLIGKENYNCLMEHKWNIVHKAVEGKYNEYINNGGR